ncbi:glycosyltransferase family 1 protein [Alkalihalobacterium bogoriense]|uniref:glycosyltransferase family 1 protein n=1 Tax=Alkalihalobacterium bogoriense TaxID=246272 RepID=UPI00068451FA|nr:glycosyltransferase family 1 protein [Alkalihalobacterium bogoriense]
MKPFRILQVVTIMNRGGLETMLMNYYRQMDRTKIQFDFMVHRNEQGHYDEEITTMGGRIITMPSIRPGHYRRYFQLLDDFFKHNTEYKVVHSHINENCSFVLKAAKEHGVPCRIAHSHLSDLGLDIKLPFRMYARYMMKDNANQYFACSEKAGEWLFGKKKVKVLNNAVNAKEFQYSEQVRNNLRTELNLKDKLVIGHIGRFNKQKNHTFLIDIFQQVKKQKPHSVLLLVGDGHLRPQIEKKVHDLGLGDSVRFLGVRNDIASLMQAMDLFLFPSLFEGLPVVLVEAQAAGLQCIVSNTITKEAKITKNVHFVKLLDSATDWANKVLSTSTEHMNTFHILREKGYDTTTMADWLTGYYTAYCKKEFTSTKLEAVT